MAIPWVPALIADPKRVENYSGTTDASGNYTVVYTRSFVTTPTIQPVIANTTETQLFKITSSTTSGFTVQIRTRSSITVLSSDLLSSATTAVVGAQVNVLVVGN
jgi:hypothetical protein